MKNPLPEWDDFGKMFMDGLYVWIAQLVYTLPFWVLLCIAIVATVGIGGIGGAIGSEEAMAASTLGIGGIITVISCATFLLVIAALFIMPALIIQYVRYDELGACFRFGEVLAIARDNVADILIALVASIVAVFALTIVIGVLSFIPCIGSIIGWVISMVIAPYIGMVVSHMYGQMAAKGEKFNPNTNFA